MFKQSHWIPAAVLMAAMAAPASAQAELPLYRVTDLGPQPGFEDVWAVDINDRGDVLGYLEDDVPQTTLCPFIWHPATGMHRCEALLPPSSLDVRRLNRDRQVAAIRYDRQPTPYAFTWSLHDGYRRLARCHPGGNTQASGINDAGEVVGGCTTGSGYHVVVWRPDGSIVDLHPDGYSGSEGLGINELGQIAVGLFIGIGGRQAGMIDRDGRATEFPCLGNVAGDCSGRSYALNGRGQVVGSSQYPDDWQTHGFIWSADTGIVQLTADGPFRDFSSDARDINDRGEVVGTMSGRLNGAEVNGPFRWTAASGARYLVDLIDPADPLAGRIQFLSSPENVAINRWGVIVTNAYIDRIYEVRTLVLTPVR